MSFIPEIKKVYDVTRKMLFTRVPGRITMRSLTIHLLSFNRLLVPETSEL